MVSVTILNDIVHPEFRASLDIQQSWGIETLDLRAGIYGKTFMNLTEDETASAVEEIQTRGLSVYCLSSGLFYDDLDKGEAYFREHHLAPLNRLIQAADQFKPQVVRLLSARFDARERVTDSIPYILEHFPWLIPMYQEAIDRLTEAGHSVTIENEARNCILATPQEIIRFFELVDRNNKISFTFDVQNLWKMGTFPTMDVYRELEPLVGYFHVKGGLAGEDGTTLKWKSTLEDAAWPVIEMTTACIRNGCTTAICLNPSHGDDLPGYDYTEMNKRNLDFLRDHIPGLR